MVQNPDCVAGPDLDFNPAHILNLHVTPNERQLHAFLPNLRLISLQVGHRSAVVAFIQVAIGAGGGLGQSIAGFVGAQPNANPSNKP